MSVIRSNSGKLGPFEASTDLVIIGAGAAGLFAGIEAGRRGKRVVLLDHSGKPAEKIRISGGGRCNFTNLETHASRFLSSNRHFAKSALARFTPWDFIERMSAHGLTWHEKTLGQLFCDQKSPAIIKFLLDDFEAAGGQLFLDTQINEITKPDDQFRIATSRGEIQTQALIIATGGLSIPKIGATGFGYDIARQFGHSIVETRPGLVPFTFSGALLERFAGLSGVATPVDIRTADKTEFHEAMLFTHRGLSGPAVLQASSYWQPGESISINYAPGKNVRDTLSDARQASPRQGMKDWLTGLFPARLADDILNETGLSKRMSELSNKDIEIMASRLARHEITPTATEGYRTAEVTVGGVNTDELSSKTMESKLCPGLYFIGEVVDVTGWLGGYNFQWAWASAHAAGTNC
ncbi:NAD(P)/FAD-dependent oxidoreductase [Ponticaulis sp.]|uniref:NAD(P)/FAD-dependent oxidoreductase n=1 Tax=Ponticaulis sp. TaxID=2020902 RepID=UPI000B645AB8|nr:NAD(P)/FAD-dependent oxidoreductase [Ponticaulis sp.]MAI89950.1 aminoacetone oxidase family FAD-binding enzyme [Ponticaulis sp.]OUX99618.1 MAG: aminoacetone oxidase family FAD-binding enzyme [Hyphomonadaceae bacterium TMED5]|tara:strand:+ start:67408 stop:68631 length:1224 start_codon:yes stop_codon:yes gene_type:complete